MSFVLPFLEVLCVLKYPWKLLLPVWWRKKSLSVFVLLKSVRFVHLQCIFMFALTWSIGATCDADGRLKFDKLIRELMEVRFRTCAVPFRVHVGLRDIPVLVVVSWYTWISGISQSRGNWEAAWGYPGVCGWSSWFPEIHFMQCLCQPISRTLCLGKWDWRMVRTCSQGPQTVRNPAPCYSGSPYTLAPGQERDVGGGGWILKRLTNSSDGKCISGHWQHPSGGIALCYSRCSHLYEFW